MVPLKVLTCHFEATLDFSLMNLLAHKNLRSCYYGQVNSQWLKSNVASKWASKRLWGVPFILLLLVPAECCVAIEATYLGRLKIVREFDVAESHHSAFLPDDRIAAVEDRRILSPKIVRNQREKFTGQFCKFFIFLWRVQRKIHFRNAR